jgi:hypothetical protein
MKSIQALSAPRALLMVLCLLAAIPVFSQFTISGTVTDATGFTIIGASVLAEDTSIGTVTDVDGKFTLNVPADVNTYMISSYIYTPQLGYRPT